MDAPSSAVSPSVSSAGMHPISVTSSKIITQRMIPWIVSGFVSCIVFLVILAIMPIEPWYAWKRVVGQYVTGSEYILADAGAMGEDYFDIVIHKAYLRRPGWIVVSALYNDSDVRCGEIFGKSEILPAGTVTNATIRIPNITPDILEETTNQPAIPAGTSVTVGIVYDDGDGDFTNPQLVRDKTGALIFARTKIGVNK